MLNGRHDKGFVRALWRLANDEASSSASRAARGSPRASSTLFGVSLGFGLKHMVDEGITNVTDAVNAVAKGHSPYASHTDLILDEANLLSVRREREDALCAAVLFHALVMYTKPCSVSARAWCRAPSCCAC
jgi:hypothetical protein